VEEQTDEREEGERARKGGLKRIGKAPKRLVSRSREFLSFFVTDIYYVFVSVDLWDHRGPDTAGGL